MSTVTNNDEVIVAKKRISETVAQARIRFETIINNHFFSAVMDRSKYLGGFLPLRHLEQLFSYAAKSTQEGKYSYGTLYQLIEVLSYFIYYCRVVMNAENESRTFLLLNQSANNRIQVRIALEMLPKNLETLSNNTRLLLAYVTNLERTTTSNPTYKRHLRLFKVEKLLFATSHLPEISDFENAYDRDQSGEGAAYSHINQ